MYVFSFQLTISHVITFLKPYTSGRLTQDQVSVKWNKRSRHFTRSIRFSTDSIEGRVCKLLGYYSSSSNRRFRVVTNNVPGNTIENVLVTKSKYPR